MKSYKELIEQLEEDGMGGALLPTLSVQVILQVSEVILFLLDLVKENQRSVTVSSWDVLCIK